VLSKQKHRSCVTLKCNKPAKSKKSYHARKKPRQPPNETVWWQLDVRRLFVALNLIMHPRSPFAGTAPDFAALALCHPELRPV
jgi:hypothetical protein